MYGFYLHNFDFIDFMSARIINLFSKSIPCTLFLENNIAL